MAWKAPSRTGACVGRSQMPWPRLMPPTRSHSRVMRRMSDWARFSSRRAMRIGAARLLRLQRGLHGRMGDEVSQGFHQHVEAALEIGERDLLVDVVAGIGLPGKPHAKGDG